MVQDYFSTSNSTLLIPFLCFIPEFLQFVVSQDACRKKWLESEGCYSDLKEKIRSLELENKTLQTKLKHARSSIDSEIKKRKRVEAVKESLERQILLVRELLTDKNHTVLTEKDRERLPFLSTDFQMSNIYGTSPHRYGEFYHLLVPP